MNEFWSTESMGVEIQPCLREAEKLSQAERQEAKLIEESCIKSGNQWIIPHPWKRDPSLLLDNKEQAIKRLETTERRLSTNPENAKAYDCWEVCIIKWKFRTVSRLIGNGREKTWRNKIQT